MKNIPNLLTIFRILLVPLFLAVFFAVSPVWALLVFFIAGVTDVLDGFLARRNGWITTLGKILDPIADKSMQCAAMIALIAGGFVPWWLALPLFAKELAQGVLAFLMLRRRGVTVVSKWYGKVAVVLFYGAVFATVPLVRANVLLPVFLIWSVVSAYLIFAFCAYLRVYLRLAARIKADPERKEL